MPRDGLFLAEMIEAGERIVTLGSSLDSATALDRNLLDALLWNFTVLGEAAARLSDELRAAHAEVSWDDPVRLRNRIVHGYWSIDLDVLVSSARDDVPAL
jgi:uncharacterized protein with HEPN domain